MQKIEQAYKKGEPNKKKAEEKYQRLFNEEFLPDWENGAYDGPNTYNGLILEIIDDYEGKVGKKVAKKLIQDASKIRKRKKKV